MIEILRMMLKSFVVCASVFAIVGSLRADVVINEIHYDPDDKTVPEEFIELHNSGEEAVSLEGWFLSEGVRYSFGPGDSIGPGEFLVIAEDPDVLAASLGYAGALGPFEGRLSNEGEQVTLRDSRGLIVDRVSYSVGFPWPIDASGKGSSMELLHPDLDNDLGGSWRSSGIIGNPPEEREYYLNRESAAWRYRKGTSEASDPVEAWRASDFVEDDTWLDGQTSIGFGDDDDNTVLLDMEDNFSSIFLRHSLEIASEDDIPSALKVSTYVDDAVIIWINGIEVFRSIGMVGDYAYDGLARRSREARWEDWFLPSPSAYLHAGHNVIAMHVFNQRVTSNDLSADLELFLPSAADYPPGFINLPPTPGAVNSVFSEIGPPQIRQVTHIPRQPPADQNIIVTAKVTDPQGVASVEVHYQINEPGQFIPSYLPLPRATLMSRPTTAFSENPQFELADNWVSVRMIDDGSGADQVAGDDVYSAAIPGQVNRSLVRYRISASDSDGVGVRVPHRDDKSLNFALYVYDGVPPYVASTRSVHSEGTGHVYPSEVMEILPVYTLITRAPDLAQCIGYNSADRIPKSNEAARDRFNWEGAFVYDGVVYDHIHFRLRQANDRYGGSGKRSMRFRFNKGSWLRARDNYGNLYPRRWRTLNSGKMFDNKRVGNFGLTESLNEQLWNMVGVPSPLTHTYHFRVVQRPDEVPASSGQYLGDFWGMYLAFEDYDPRFLDTHRLEDGNLYKLKDGQFNANTLKRNQGREAILTDADFQNIRRNLRPTQSGEWLDSHVNYDRWNRYHAVVEGIRHYDFRPADSHSKNRAWYFEPVYTEENEFGRVWTLPHDSDASWGPNWNSGVDYSKNAIFAGGGKPVFKQNYRNNIREFRDLIWTEEVMHQMIDDLASFVSEFSKADRDRWRGAPATAGQQDFGPMATKVTDMKRFAFIGWSGSTGPSVPAGGRARHLDNLANAEGDRTQIPETPVVTSTGPEDHPLDRLTFQVSDFADPQEEDSVGALRWRVAEVTAPDAPFDPDRRRQLEVPSLWEDEIDGASTEIHLPSTLFVALRTYRVRARYMDETGRWSHWSEPVEFVAGEAMDSTDQQRSLRITELMFNPLGDDDFEYIELQNIGSRALDLSGVRFLEGVTFDFSSSEVATLDPGEFVVVVKSADVFRARYPREDALIAGEYSGNLSNAGERLVLSLGQGAPILDFEFDDEWELESDGAGKSLVIVDPADSAAGNWGLASSWRPSHEIFGSPGREDVPVAEGLQLPGNVDGIGGVNISDAVALLRHLFSGDRLTPCSDDASSAIVLDIDGDGRQNITDGIHLLNYLFLRGLPPALGTDCTVIEGCPTVCGG